MFLCCFGCCVNVLDMFFWFCLSLCFFLRGLFGGGFLALFAGLVVDVLGFSVCFVRFFCFFGRRCDVFATWLWFDWCGFARVVFGIPSFLLF